jgi:hypothetical protein
MNDEELENKYVFTNNEIKKEINEKIRKRMYKYRDNVRDLFKKIKIN